MQHWWKWLLVLFAASGVLLISRMPRITGNTTVSASLRHLGIARAEAAVSASTIDPVVRKVAGYSASYWPRWTTPATKIVPIISAGTPGLRLGLAQVSGPKQEVNRVRAVLQLDADFKSVRMKILVPSDSYTDLRRVQGTAVTGIVQYKLLDFSSHENSRPSSRYITRDRSYDDWENKPCEPEPPRGKSKWKKHHGQYKDHRNNGWRGE